MNSLANFGVRNIAGYNAKVEEFNRSFRNQAYTFAAFGVIVDELADLRW